MGTKLYVGNLPFQTTENDLQDAFSQHGAVREVHVVLDRATGRLLGVSAAAPGLDVQDLQDLQGGR
jgi:RNA recognition motif-containing protein